MIEPRNVRVSDRVPSESIIFPLTRMKLRASKLYAPSTTYVTRECVASHLLMFRVSSWRLLTTKLQSSTLQSVIQVKETNFFIGGEVETIILSATDQLIPTSTSATLQLFFTGVDVNQFSIKLRLQRRAGRTPAGFI